MGVTLSSAMLFGTVAAIGEQAAAASRGHNPGSLGPSLLFGLQVGVLGMVVVFAGLVAVYAFMVTLRRVLDRRPRRASGEDRPPEITAEIAHAIALALFMDLRTFDDETAEAITIRKLTRPFSPWMDSGKAGLILDNRSVFRR